MSHITQAQQGLAAVEARNWELAISKLSPALKTSSNPSWLIARSKALVGTKRFKESLEDADLAWHSAYQRNKRPLMFEAQYRRAVAYYRLKEYANADCCCIYALRLSQGFAAVEKEDPSRQYVDEDGFWTETVETAKAAENREDGDKGDISKVMAQKTDDKSKECRSARVLRCQILSAMERLPTDDPARKPTTSLKPPSRELAEIKANEAANDDSSIRERPKASTAPSKVAGAPNLSAAPLRLQEFQNDTTMSVSIFSKGNKKDKLQVEILPRHVRLNPIVYPNGEEKEFRINLWGEIDPNTSTYTVTSSKVELSLKKKVPGKWAQLKSDGNQTIGITEKGHVAPVAAEQSVFPPRSETASKADSPAAVPTGANNDNKTPAPAGPAYPTSSKSGPKNWDKFEGGSDDEDAQDVNFFFKKLYKGATPEQQRAMMKSFTESNGTSLSTDWNDVKDRTVETVPPDGVQAKKWE